MQSLIDQLRALNRLDTRMGEVQAELVSLPRELAAKEEELQRLQEQAARLKEEAGRLRLEADAAELELKSGEETLKRYAGQMNVVRTTREFEAIRRQMDAQRGWNREAEDKALKFLAQCEKELQEANNLLQQGAGLETTLAEERRRIQQRSAELETELTGLRTEREKLAAEIPQPDLQLYARISINRGEAIAQVQAGGICSACRMKLPPQVHNLVLLAQELTTCPSCGRILTTS
jgi:hypothetical protein